MLPDGFFTLKALAQLNLAHNALTTLPEGVANLNALKALDLSHNRLERFPIDLCFLSSLTRLVLSDNKLSALPNDVSMLSSLAELDVSSNVIVELQALEMPRLKTLRANHNRLESLPSLASARKLESVSVNHNSLTHLDDTVLEDLSTLPCLQVFEAHHNKIR